MAWHWGENGDRTEQERAELSKSLERATA